MSNGWNDVGAEEIEAALLESLSSGSSVGPFSGILSLDENGEGSEFLIDTITSACGTYWSVHKAHAESLEDIDCLFKVLGLNPKADSMFVATLREKLMRIRESIAFPEERPPGAKDSIRFILALARRRQASEGKPLIEQRKNDDISNGSTNQYNKARKWPDPRKHTTAKSWTNKSGDFCLSTKTEGQPDGSVTFSPTTKQANLMQLLCFDKCQQQIENKLGKKSHVSIKIVNLLQEIYPDEISIAGKDVDRIKKVLKRLRSLISDLRRKKLEPSGINPAILPGVSIEANISENYSLHVVHIKCLDDSSSEARETSIDPDKLDHLRRQDHS